MEKQNKNLGKLILAGASIAIPIAISEATGLTNELMNFHTLWYDAIEKLSAFGYAIKPEEYLLRGLCDFYVGVAGLCGKMLLKEFMKKNKK